MPLPIRDHRELALVLDSMPVEARMFRKHGNQPWDGLRVSPLSTDSL